MNERQFTPVRNISPESPFTAYARDAVALTRDQRQGVLERRIADYLATAVLGMPWVHMDNLPVGVDPEFYRGMARVCVALCLSIDDSAPPTPTEILRYELNKRIQLARSRVRCIGSANRHRLSAWRPDTDREGVELVRCLCCQAGASLDLSSGDESISDALRADCPGRRA